MASGWDGEDAAKNLARAGKEPMGSRVEAVEGQLTSAVFELDGVVKDVLLRLLQKEHTDHTQCPSCDTRVDFTVPAYSDQMKALQFLFDRVVGRPRESSEVVVSKRISLEEFGRLSDEELERLANS